VKRGAIVGIAVAAAAVLVGGGLAWWLLARPPSVEDAARSYLDALSAGDFASIDSMRSMRLDVSVLQEHENALPQCPSRGGGRRGFGTTVPGTDHRGTGDRFQAP